MDATVDSIFHQLQQCIDEGRADILRAILSTVESTDRAKLRQILSFCTQDGSLLHMTCQKRVLDGVRILLGMQLDPCMVNSKGQTALIAVNHDKDVYAVFLQQCVFAITQSNLEYLSRLLRSGMSVNSADMTDPQKNSLLHWACHFSNTTAVQFLIDNGADVNISNKDGITPLHLSILKSEVDVVHLLVKNGANPSISVQSGPYAEKNCFDLCSILDNSTLLMQALSKAAVKSNSTLRESNLTPTEFSDTYHKNPLVIENGAASVNSLHSSDRNDESNGGVKVMTFQDFSKDSVLDRCFWPRPQQSQLLLDHSYKLPPSLVISLNKCEGEAVLNWITSELAHMKPRTLIVNKPVHGLSLELGHHVCRGRPEAYHMEVTTHGIRLLALDLRGLMMGAVVLASLIKACSEATVPLVPGLLVWDWPTTTVRAVLVDCSAGLIPRVGVLMTLAENVLRMRGNQLHLFFRLSPSQSLSYSQEELRSTVSQIQRIYLLDVALAVDIAVGVSDLTQVQNQLEVLLGAFSNQAKLHFGPRMSSHLTQCTENEFPHWLLSNRPLVFFSSCAFPLPIYLMKQPILCADHSLPRDSVEDRANYLHSFVTSFVLAPATGAWLSLTGCYSLHKQRLAPGLARAVSTLPSLSGVVSCDWDGGGIGPHLLTSMPLHALTIGLAWNPTAGQEAQCTGYYSRWLCDSLMKLEVAESAVSKTDKPSPYQSLFCGVLPGQDMQVHALPKLNLKLLAEQSQSPTDKLALFTAELTLLCHQMIARPLINPAQRTDFANKVIKLKQEAKTAWSAVYLTTAHLNTALLTFDTLVSNLLRDVEIPDVE